jgi:sulfatase maturation enzyme AslB (radical SAM superfamily)
MELTKWIEITTRIGCSSKCEYCPQSKLVKKYTSYSDEIYMLMNTFEKCISTIPEEVQIHFTGFSEPFLNPLIMKFIEYSLNKGHHILINTTLRGMQEKYIDHLQILFLKKLWVGPLSIHLPCNEYKTNIVSKRYYEILKYTLHRLKNLRFHIHGTMIKEIDDFIKSNFGNYHLKCSGIHSRAGNVEFKDISELPKKYSCPRIFDHVLLPNGDVVLCCVDYGLEEIIGNLREMTYEELHLTEQFKNIVKNGSKLCKKCEF